MNIKLNKLDAALLPLCCSHSEILSLAICQWKYTFSKKNPSADVYVPEMLTGTIRGIIMIELDQKQTMNSTSNVSISHHLSALQTKKESENENTIELMRSVSQKYWN